MRTEGKNYRIEVRDSRERWHRPRGHAYRSAAAAMQNAPAVAAQRKATAWRLVHAGSGRVEYTEFCY